MRLGRRRVDSLDARVSVRAAHECRVRHARKLQVIDVAAPAGDEAWILATLDRLPEQSLCGGGSHGLPLLPGRHVLSGPLDRLDDVVIAGAPAEVALELVPDLVFARVRVALEDLVRRHDHARRAETALESVLLPEALLDGVKLAVFGQALDRGDGGAIGLDRKERARLHRQPIHEDGAGAALARVAADVRARETDHLTDVVDEKQSGLDLVAVRLAVDGDLDWQFHGASSEI